MTLFDLPPLPDGEPVENPSAGQRLTIRNKAAIAAGWHPATGRALLAVETCGTCAYHHYYRWHTRSYHKCDQHRLGESHSEASDIRVSWPACVLWVGIDPEPGPRP